eukprot:COSAG05_NODE_4015_length_1721_cov_0.694821_2_plen_189_part_00
MTGPVVPQRVTDIGVQCHCGLRIGGIKRMLSCTEQYRVLKLYVCCQEFISHFLSSCVLLPFVSGWFLPQRFLRAACGPSRHDWSRSHPLQRTISRKWEEHPRAIVLPGRLQLEASHRSLPVVTVDVPVIAHTIALTTFRPQASAILGSMLASSRNSSVEVSLIGSRDPPAGDDLAIVALHHHVMCNNR